MSSSKRTAIYAGSFDPITLGHVDIIERAQRLFDRVIVAVGVNMKKPGLFTVEERCDMIRVACKAWPTIEVTSFQDLVVNFAARHQAAVFVRGVRNEQDFAYELQMALMNRSLAKNIETIFIPTRQEYLHISSSLVREVASFKGDISSLVPGNVVQAITTNKK